MAWERRDREGGRLVKPWIFTKMPSAVYFLLISFRRGDTQLVCRETEEKGKEAAGRRTGPTPSFR